MGYSNTLLLTELARLVMQGWMQLKMYAITKDHGTTWTFFGKMIKQHMKSFDIMATKHLPLPVMNVLLAFNDTFTQQPLQRMMVSIIQVSNDSWKCLCLLLPEKIKKKHQRKYCPFDDEIMGNTNKEISVNSHESKPRLEDKWLVQINTTPGFVCVRSRLITLMKLHSHADIRLH